jgi:hypothetical protein
MWWMPWQSQAMKDVVWLRKVSGRCQATVDPEISEWGNPAYMVTRKGVNGGN